MNKNTSLILVCLIIAISIFSVFSVLFIGSQDVGDLMVKYVDTSSYNKQIQQALKDLGYYQGSIDGIIGQATTSAIKKFQSDNGLVADGIVGEKTAAKLNLGGTTQSSSDLYLLAKCIHAEARGEEYVGQVAVAAVILNRVKSPEFPNTISGVIYQPWAFTAVNDGQINLEPNSTAYQAAKDAMNGWDPTYGCLYYYNPVTATSKWIYSRQVVLTIGKHVFAL